MKEILYKLFEHQYLGRKEAREILQGITQGKYNDAQIASLITVFLMRSISVEELIGFREALLEMRIPVDLNEFEPIDIVGTGGDGKNTFNVSTCACFVVAGAGYPVVKHGNYGATSVSGASNVMEQHGVKFTADNDSLRRSLERCNIAYLHAPLFNRALKAVAPIRKALGVRTFFNMLGPLVNPVMPTYQLLGVYNLRDAIRRRAQPRRIRRDFADVGFQSGHAGQRKALFARRTRIRALSGSRPVRRRHSGRSRRHFRSGITGHGYAGAVQLRNCKRGLRDPGNASRKVDRYLHSRSPRVARGGKSPAYIRKIRRTEQLIR